MIKFNNDWDELLKTEFSSEYYSELRQKLKEEYYLHEIYPPANDIFNAFKLTSYENVKVVILGQDPYHGTGQAHGLSFSVNEGIRKPPSLENIFKELKDDLGYEIPKSGNLTKWAKQGILLLNATLTVRAGQPNSHQNLGWETFTDNIIKLLNRHVQPLVFLLWGNNAKRKARFVTSPKHLILQSVHPSPFSASDGFFGCKHFSKSNEFLNLNKRQPIDWNLNDE